MPVPSLVRPLVLVEEITPEKVVLVLSPPAFRLYVRTTLPEPASEPMVSTPNNTFSVAPLSTITAPVLERDWPPLTDRVPAEIVVAPVWVFVVAGVVSTPSTSVPAPALVSRVEPLTTPDKVPVLVAATSIVPPPVPI